MDIYSFMYIFVHICVCVCVSVSVRVSVCVCEYASVYVRACALDFFGASLSRSLWLLSRECAQYLRLSISLAPRLNACIRVCVFPNVYRPNGPFSLKANRGRFD